jgi:hypothetical protein
MRKGWGLKDMIRAKPILRYCSLWNNLRLLLRYLWLVQSPEYWSSETNWWIRLNRILTSSVVPLLCGYHVISSVHNHHLAKDSLCFLASISDRGQTRIRKYRTTSRALFLSALFLFSSAPSCPVLLLPTLIWGLILPREQQPWIWNSGSQNLSLLQDSKLNSPSLVCTIFYLVWTSILNISVSERLTIDPIAAPGLRDSVITCSNPFNVM